MNQVKKILLVCILGFATSSMAEPLTDASTADTTAITGFSITTIVGIATIVATLAVSSSDDNQVAATHQ